jgi:hypothetical protein
MLHAPDISGQVRLVATDVQASLRGPLAQAEALSPGMAALPASSVALASELRGSAGVFTLAGTLQRQHTQGSGWRDESWVNELYAAGGAQAWQFSAGKRVAAGTWARPGAPTTWCSRSAAQPGVTSTLEGRRLLMAEYFSASTAWSAVWVNPQKSRRQRRCAEEPALALRLYQRDGARGLARLCALGRPHPWQPGRGGGLGGA